MNHILVFIEPPLELNYVAKQNGNGGNKSNSTLRLLSRILRTLCRTYHVEWTFRTYCRKSFYFNEWMNEFIFSGPTGIIFDHNFRVWVNKHSNCDIDIKQTEHDVSRPALSCIFFVLRTCTWWQTERYSLNSDIVTLIYKSWKTGEFYFIIRGKWFRFTVFIKQYYNTTKCTGINYGFAFDWYPIK